MRAATSVVSGDAAAEEHGAKDRISLSIQEGSAALVVKSYFIFQSRSQTLQHVEYVRTPSYRIEDTRRFVFPYSGT